MRGSFITAKLAKTKQKSPKIGAFSRWICFNYSDSLKEDSHNSQTEQQNRIFLLVQKLQNALLQGFLRIRKVRRLPLH